MSAGPVTVARQGDVAIVTISRAEKRNALNAEAARAVKTALEDTADARVVLLTGEGKAFCAGGDLEELQSWSELEPQAIADELYGSFQGMVRAARASDAVVIAAVNGAAVGAGMDLALACDMRVASERARFGQVWVGLGVIPGTGGAFLTQHIAGAGRAADLLLTGRIIDAQEALGMGLVNEVVPHEALMDAARARAGTILDLPREGVIANKRAYVSLTDPVVEAALEHARAVQPGRFTSEEFKEQVRKRLG